MNIKTATRIAIGATAIGLVMSVLSPFFSDWVINAYYGNPQTRETAQILHKMYEIVRSLFASGGVLVFLVAMSQQQSEKRPLNAPSSWIARLFVNALIGAIAGAVPAVAWMAWQEATGGFHNGFGGLAWLAALGAGILLGGLVGGVVGAAGGGVRVVGLGNVIRVMVGACIGAVFGAGVGCLVAGLGNEVAVVGVVVVQAVGLALGQLLLTAPQTAPDPHSGAA